MRSSRLLQLLFVALPFAAAVMYPGLSSAQGPGHTISGTAYEFPGCMGYMRGWTVVLDPVGSIAQTDLQSGTFSFSGVPDGSYTLVMSASCNPYGCWDDVPVTVAGVDRTGLQICPHGPVATSTPTPTATPALSYQSNASPPSGTYVDPTAAPTFSYSLVISNAGQTAVTPLIVHFDLIDVAGPPTAFSSTQGTCAWSDQPDYYHGASTGECDLGTLPPAGGSPSSATVNLNGTIFWNFYSHEYAHVAVSVNGTPVAGITYPFGTPTPTGTPIAGSTPDPPSVGGIAEPPEDFGGTHGGGGLPVGEIAMLAGVAVVAASAGGWYARRRFGRQRR